MQLRPLRDEEISYRTSASKRPLVATPASLGFDGDASELVHFLGRRGLSIRSSVAENGAVLFRGFPVEDPWRFQRALAALGYDLYESNLGGASPRAKVTDQTFVSTEAPAPFIIGYHTEFCYQSRRPSMISFYCSRPPERFGETPLFDCATVYDALSESLRWKLESRGVRYRRFFPGKTSAFNFRKTWREAFSTDDRSVVRDYLDAEGMDYCWDVEGSLSTSLRLPAVLVDPETRRKYLSITMFNGDSFVYNFRRFRERYRPWTRCGLEWFVRRECARKDCFLHVSFGDGTSFSRAESEEIQRAAWESAIVFRWQPRDFVILDNVRFAHSRLNVKRPRAIVAAMADPYDVRDYVRRAEARASSVGPRPTPPDARGSRLGRGPRRPSPTSQVTG